jgi:hypothetical protein
MIKQLYVISTLLFSLYVGAAEYGARPELKEGLGGVSASVPTSIVALLGNPEKWGEKIVSVEGVLRSDFHGVILFLSSEYCQRFSSQYGVQIALENVSPKLSWEQLPTNECKFSEVQGEFINTPASEPEPNTITFRQRPGVINAQFIYVE